MSIFKWYEKNTVEGEVKGIEDRQIIVLSLRSKRNTFWCPAGMITFRVGNSIFILF